MEKIKSFLESDKGKDILIVIIVILVGLGSFELGRLSKESDSGGIKIDHPNQNYGQGDNLVQPKNSTQTSIKNTDVNLVSSEKNFFASTRGSKYYSLGCVGGKTIKQENRIYFTTGEEAEQAGYTLSGSCS